MIGEIRQNFTEASASVGLILATALWYNMKGALYLLLMTIIIIIIIFNIIFIINIIIVIIDFIKRLEVDEKPVIFTIIIINTDPNEQIWTIFVPSCK